MQAPIVIIGMVEGIRDCPHRHYLGRSAPTRLKRCLAYAEQANIATPKLMEINNSINNLK